MPKHWNSDSRFGVFNLACLPTSFVVVILLLVLPIFIDGTNIARGTFWYISFKHNQCYH